MFHHMGYKSYKHQHLGLRKKQIMGVSWEKLGLVQDNYVASGFPCTLHAISRSIFMTYVMYSHKTGNKWHFG